MSNNNESAISAIRGLAATIKPYRAMEAENIFRFVELAISSIDYLGKLPRGIQVLQDIAHWLAGPGRETDEPAIDYLDRLATLAMDAHSTMANAIRDVLGDAHWHRTLFLENITGLQMIESMSVLAGHLGKTTLADEIRGIATAAIPKASADNVVVTLHRPHDWQAIDLVTHLAEKVGGENGAKISGIAEHWQRLEAEESSSPAPTHERVTVDNRLWHRDDASSESEPKLSKTQQLAADIAKLTPAQVIRYVLVRDWQLYEVFEDKALMFSSPDRGGDDIMVVLRPELADYVRRTYELVEALAAVEDRWPHEVVADMLSGKQPAD